MHERDLLKRRRDDWEALEQLTGEAEKKGVHRLQADALTAIGPLYRKTLADLALAQRHFPQSPVVGYLNRLVARTHALIYGNSSMNWRGALRFVTHTFPTAVRENMRTILVMAALFFTAAIVGAWGWTHNNPVVMSIFPSEQAAEMQHLTADEFNPISPEAKPIMTSFVMTNNIRVSFLAFALGVTFGVGTLWIVWINGLILGPLAAVYHEAGYGVLFWSLILPHGVLELPAIFICAAAGWKIGKALLVPGAYRRLDAAKVASRQALILLGGTVILLVIAGVIEGFITPTGIAPWAKLLFAAIVFALFVGYLVVFPRRENQAYPTKGSRSHAK